MHWNLRILLALCVLGTSFAISCAEDDNDSGTPTEENTANPEESEAPLSDLDALLEGAPDNDKLPDEAKSDAVFPRKFDLADTQSPVKSQGSRGVCSIFSTVALMEHLYIKEGTISDPDFSEQFLQWSVKTEVGAFTKTGGSNASSNLKAIERYGVVDEATMPYESRGWNSSNDERCTGEDDQPTICYTNGTPSEEIQNAKRWKLPRSRWISSRRKNIKAFMHQNKTAVVAGMTFFYQSWNHRGSKLKTNRNHWSEGYILYPSEADKTDSLARRAGHSILIVGWDDDLEVPLIDEEGKEILNEDGTPQTEKGFFLIKNSWGTGGFGIRNEFGAGYGWLSMKYVEEYASINSTTEPRVVLDPEVCDDGQDNDFDNLTDCEDPQCSDNPVCNTTAEGLVNNTPTDIPDNDPAGVSSTIEVDSEEGFVESVVVNVDITHPFQGDLQVTLISPDGRRSVLHDKTGGGTNDINRSFTPSDFTGTAVQGTWTLEVIDSADGDKGILNSWSLAFTTTSAAPEEVCDDGIDNSGNGLIDCADDACLDASSCASNGPATYEGENLASFEIPDNDASGISSPITIDGNGAITNVVALVEIEHTYISDLTVSLVHPDGSTVVLSDKAGGSNQNLSEIYELDDFNGKSATGTWNLKAVDDVGDDVGTITGWTLSVDVE